jgi:hypothetical protein
VKGGVSPFFGGGIEMNEEMKRLIDVLNKGGYEVMALEEKDSYVEDNVYHPSGLFVLTVFDVSKDPPKPPVNYA